MAPDNGLRGFEVDVRGPGDAVPGRGPRRVAVSALTWVVVFTAFHVYWFCGGRFGFGGATDALPSVHSIGGAAYAAIVAGMITVGTWLPIQIFIGRHSRIPWSLVVGCIGAGSVLLLLRGTLGLFDQALRETGLAVHGLSGLSYEQTMGDAHPTAYTLWSGVFVDAYFVLGGMLHGLLWLRLRTRRWARDLAPAVKRR